MTNHVPTNPEQLLSRRMLAIRWGVSIATIKRRERDGFLRPIKFNSRLIRYRLDHIEDYEALALM